MLRTFVSSDPLQKLNLSPPVKAHVFVTLGKFHLKPSIKCVSQFRKIMNQFLILLLGISRVVAKVLCTLAVQDCSFWWAGAFCMGCKDILYFMSPLKPVNHSKAVFVFVRKIVSSEWRFGQTVHCYSCKGVRNFWWPSH